MNSDGMLLDGKHSTEFGLILKSVYIPTPEPKVNKIEIPGANGSLDLTEISGAVPYNDREGLEFICDLIDGTYDKWMIAMQEINDCIHGRKIPVILDSDPNYYYMCRLSVDYTKSNPVQTEVVLAGTADPYKYDVTSSLDDWLWDTLNFENGVIRELKDIEVTNGKEITIPGGSVGVAPVFIVARWRQLQVEYNGKTYDLSPGRTRYPQIQVGKESVTLKFVGSGTLSIDYRGRYL